MTPLQLIMLLISGFSARWPCVSCKTVGLTPSLGKYRRNRPPYNFPLTNIKYMEEAAIIPGAENRGPRWYGSNSEVSVESDLNTTSASSSVIETEHTDKSISTSSEIASSQETTERRRRIEVYRECSPCPMDMIMRHTNRGIKWICGMYQRAQRSFKSICMMRYRNCQDGTMFVKTADHRCAEDTYHGRHWFYVYRV